MKKYEEATNELTEALKVGVQNPECGFIRGRVLADQNRWAQAAAVYTEVSRLEPDFPEIHTKLSLVFCKLGEGDQALREAKAALGRTPNNAEALKNEGLAFENLRDFDASIDAYQKALKIEPDYEAVHYDLGRVLFYKGDLDQSIVEYKRALPR
jgi:tetratricopeptide (TPR) repeat protein